MAGGDQCWGKYNRDEAGGEAEVKGLHLQIRSEKVAMETLDKGERSAQPQQGEGGASQPCGQQVQRPWGPGGGVWVRRDSRRQGLERSRGAEGLVGCCLDVGFYSQAASTAGL